MRTGASGRLRPLLTRLAGVAVIAMAVAGPSLAARPEGKGPPAGSPGGGGPVSFTIEGAVSGLYPGGARTLPLQVTNEGPQAIEIVRLDVAVADASPACPAEALEVEAFDGSLLVPARDAVEVEITVRMRTGAPDPCQGATFPLTYTGEGTKADAGR